MVVDYVSPISLLLTTKITCTWEGGQTVLLLCWNIHSFHDSSLSSTGNGLGLHFIACPIWLNIVKVFDILIDWLIDWLIDVLHESFSKIWYLFVIYYTLIALFLWKFNTIFQQDVNGLCFIFLFDKSIIDWLIDRLLFNVKWAVFQMY